MHLHVFLLVRGNGGDPHSQCGTGCRNGTYPLSLVTLLLIIIVIVIVNNTLSPNVLRSGCSSPLLSTTRLSTQSHTSTGKGSTVQERLDLGIQPRARPLGAVGRGMPPAIDPVDLRGCRRIVENALEFALGQPIAQRLLIRSAHDEHGPYVRRQVLESHRTVLRGVVEGISEAQDAGNAAAERIVVGRLGRLVRPRRRDRRVLPHLVIGAHPVDDGATAKGLADENEGRAGGEYACIVRLPLDGVRDDAEVGVERSLRTDRAPDLAVVAGTLGDDDDAAQPAELRLEGAVAREDAASSGTYEEQRFGTVGGGRGG
mmetsp:Transcript_20597/g.59060  ORF Transcript_20597/g.59060 Transcript_20597/m.59060 type:complete len:315 (+) Transcript_20597:70-1014(+)